MIRRPVRRGTAVHVSLEYIDGAGDLSRRTVLPLGIITNDIGRTTASATYLHAKCSIAKAPRTFRIDRVQSISDPATGEVIDVIPWLQSLQLGEAKPWTWDDDLDFMQGGGEEADSDPGDANPLPSGHSWQKLKLAGYAGVVGYLIGRLRVIPWLLERFHQHWGLWL